MLQTGTNGHGRDGGGDDPSAVNDDNPFPAKTITFTDLALAMQIDEDLLLHRLATILRKRESGPDTSASGE